MDPSATRKMGVLLINLGTPDSPSAWDVGRYLREFLMDPWVVDIPWIARALLVHAIILPFRSFKSAHAYASIWTKDGSPLRTYHMRFVEKLKKKFPDQPMEAVMRYGNPSISSGLKALQKSGVSEIVVWPLYPQWAWASTESSLQKVRAELQKLKWKPQIRVIEDFYDQPQFISAFVKNVKKEQAAFKPDFVLFSFHGIPERHLFKKDQNVPCLKNGCCDRVDEKNRYCYRAQCYATAKAIATQSGLDPSRWHVSFQSRLGRTPWIQPYTDIYLKQLGSNGTAQRVLVVSPSFVADCLETLEEIAVRERESFIQSGGQDLRLVASLNDGWIEEAQQLLKENMLTN